MYSESSRLPNDVQWMVDQHRGRAGLKAVVHGVIAAIDWAAFVYQGWLGAREELHFGWILNYLTLWGLATQAVFFTLSAALDGYIAIKPHSNQGLILRLFKHRSRFFTLCFCLGTFVSVIYWLGLFPEASNREYFGHEIDQTILTLITHGFTGIAIWVELIWVPHKYRDWKLESGIAVAYGVTYLAWNMICYSQNDAWAYPTLQGDKSWYASILLYTVLILVELGFYAMGRFLSKCRWRKTPLYSSTVEEQAASNDASEHRGAAAEVAGAEDSNPTKGDVEMASVHTEEPHTGRATT